MENKKFECCPFCASNEIDTWDKIAGSGRTKFFAYCLKCGCEGPTADSLEQAVNLWNRRGK